MARSVRVSGGGGAAGLVSGTLKLTGDISASFTANEEKDDWNPTGLSTASVIRCTTAGGAPGFINGITGGTDGRLLVIAYVTAYSANPSDYIALQHEKLTSTAENRILTPDGTNTTIAPNQAAILMYDATSSRWRLIAVSGIVIFGDNGGTSIAATGTLTLTTGDFYLSSSGLVSLALDQHSINDLGDVDTATSPPGYGSRLYWDGNNWTPKQWPVAYLYYKEHASATQQLSNGTLGVYTELTNIDTEDLDNIGLQAPSSGRITPTAGWYMVFGNVSFAGNTTGMRGAALLTGGSTVIAQSEQKACTNASDDAAIPVSYLGYFDGATTLSLGAYQTSGGNLNVQSGQNATFLCLVKLNSRRIAKFDIAANQTLTAATPRAMIFANEVFNRGNHFVWNLMVTGSNRADGQGGNYLVGLNGPALLFAQMLLTAAQNGTYSAIGVTTGGDSLGTTATLYVPQGLTAKSGQGLFPWRLSPKGVQLTEVSSSGKTADSTGVSNHLAVFVPGEESMQVIARVAAQKSINNATWTKINQFTAALMLGDSSDNESTKFALATNSDGIKVPATGKYLVVATNYAGQNYDVGVRITNGGTDQGFVRHNTPPTITTGNAMATIVSATANDELLLEAWQRSGGAANVPLDATTGIDEITLYILYLGA